MVGQIPKTTTILAKTFALPLPVAEGRGKEANDALTRTFGMHDLFLSQQVKRGVHVRALIQVNPLALIWAPHQPESCFDVPPCFAFFAVSFFGKCSCLFGSNDSGLVAVCFQQLLRVFADFDFLHR
jgi:hypothetical protein